jgi:hypothetical protein
MCGPSESVAQTRKQARWKAGEWARCDSVSACFSQLGRAGLSLLGRIGLYKPMRRFYLFLFSFIFCFFFILNYFESKFRIQN